MSDDARRATGTSPNKDVPVDWEALEDAFENNAPEVHSYLHIDSGEVLRVVDGIADPEMHSRIASDAAYMRIESVSSREQYRWMERIIQMVDSAPLRASLAQAIDGKGAFRRFKDVLMAHSAERERWFVFRSERLRVFMEAWLAAHALNPVARPEWVAEGGAEAGETPVPAPSPEAKSQPATPNPAQRRVRSADGLRRQLRELIDGLGTRDLDKVLAFAEFIKARRIARGHSRSEASSVDNPPPDPPDNAPADGDGATPSEARKMKLIK